MIVQILLIVSVFNGATTGLQASDFHVADLPLLPKNISLTRMHAGYLPVYPTHHGALFFWHFARKYDTDKSRTVIWLEGGPGCSSMTAAWLNIGPFRFQDNETIVENNASWHWFTNLLFVDQPVGTGFSYIDPDSLLHELDEIAEEFLGFLDRYIEIFPELLDNDIYLAGQSFGGQYIPYVAQAILQKRLKLKLRGLLIGNGWIDPATTYQSYLPFAVAHQLIEKDSILYHTINNQVKLCQKTLSQQIHVMDVTCDDILTQISLDGPTSDFYKKNHANRCINVYNIEDQSAECDMNSSLDFERIKNYLHRKDVMSRIHVDSTKSDWSKCSISVLKTFKAYHSQPAVKLLPDLLRQIPVVLYSGEYDLICNHWATETMISNMVWNNRKGFDLGNGKLAPIESWTVENEPAGLLRVARNLTYILFDKAGHSVIYSQTHRSRAMLHQFFKFNPNSTGSQTENKNVGLIISSIIFITTVFTGSIWFFLYKKYHSRVPTPLSITRIIRSKYWGTEQHQSVVYSLLNDQYDEDSYPPINAALV